MCPLRPLLLLFCLICAAGFFFACNAPQPAGEVPADQISATPSSRPHADSAKTVFNLAALVDLSANQVRARLGKPISDQQESENEEMKSMLYRRQGYELSIDYEVQSQRLIQIYFTTGDKPWKKPDAYLRAGNVSLTGKHYKLHLLNQEGDLLEGIAIAPDSARTMDSFGHWVVPR